MLERQRSTPKDAGVIAVVDVYWSNHGTPLNMRALPISKTGKYNAYKVLKPFEVQSSTIAPAFGKIGLGKQYLSPVKCQEPGDYLLYA